MKTVAVIGGGPAGATAAERLSRGGLRTVLIDEKLAWEKPCGGGITYKAYSQYPYLIQSDRPKKLVHQAVIEACGSGSSSLDMEKPLLIYSRYELNDMLLGRAAAAGARVEQARVLGIERHGSGWMLRTNFGFLEADYCILANGARNRLKQLGTEWSARDTAVALGYYIPSVQSHVDLRFLSGFEGYIWVFPRHDHLSAGICGKGETSHAMRARLERYLEEKQIPLGGATFYAHVLPSLHKQAWEQNRVAGDGWMAVGDAAGLVDPVTGEGLYYAIRSADLAAGIVLAGSANPGERYRAQLRRECTEDLALASPLARRLFLGKFLGRTVPARMVEWMRFSPSLCSVLQDLFAGSQNYASLKPRLRKCLARTAGELLINGCLRRANP